MVEFFAVGYPLALIIRQCCCANEGDIYVWLTSPFYVHNRYNIFLSVIIIMTWKVKKEVELRGVVPIPSTVLKIMQFSPACTRWYI